jgi:hypothetical protein
MTWQATEVELDDLAGHQVVHSLMTWQVIKVGLNGLPGHQG